ncbi:hypothetical protein ACLOJK_003647 [Asimina triloba]
MKKAFLALSAFSGPPRFRKPPPAAAAAAAAIHPLLLANPSRAVQRLGFFCALESPSAERWVEATARNPRWRARGTWRSKRAPRVLDFPRIPWLPPLSLSLLLADFCLFPKSAGIQQEGDEHPGDFGSSRRHRSLFSALLFCKRNLLCIFLFRSFFLFPIYDSGLFELG